MKIHFIHFVANMFHHTQNLKRSYLLTDHVLTLCFTKLMDFFAYVVVLLQYH